MRGTLRLNARLALVAVTSLAFVGGPAFASIIAFDNIDPNPNPWPYQQWGRFTGSHPAGYYTVTTSFESAITGPLDELWAGLISNNVGHQNIVTLTLYDDSNGAPGTPMWSTTRTNELTIYYGQLSHLTNLNGPVLQATQRYWLEAAAVQDGYTIQNWYHNNQGDYGPVLTVNGVVNADRSSLRIGVAPEPASLSLLALGALAVLRRRS